MKIVSLNLSRPRAVEYRGGTVSTSIYNLPVDGPRRVRRLNIDGDQQADLRVPEEGRIQAGDTIVAAQVDTEAPTVESMHRLYYLDKQNLELLRQAASCQSLAPGFRDVFRARLEQLEGRA